MTMKVSINVKNRREGDAMLRGLGDPAVHAFVMVMGALRMLPSKRAQLRVLQYVSDRLEEENVRGEDAGRGID
jgi:hypothetical protein